MERDARCMNTALHLRCRVVFMRRASPPLVSCRIHAPGISTFGVVSYSCAGHLHLWCRVVFMRRASPPSVSCRIHAPGISTFGVMSYSCAGHLHLWCHVVFMRRASPPSVSCRIHAPGISTFGVVSYSCAGHLHLWCRVVFMRRASRSIRCSREKPISHYIFLCTLALYTIFTWHTSLFALQHNVKSTLCNYITVNYNSQKHLFKGGFRYSLAFTCYGSW